MNSAVAFEFMKDVERWNCSTCSTHALYVRNVPRSRCLCLPLTVRTPKPAQSAVSCWRLWHLVGSGKSLAVESGEFLGWFMRFMRQRDSVWRRISVPCESLSSAFDSKTPRITEAHLRLSWQFPLRTVFHVVELCTSQEKVLRKVVGTDTILAPRASS